MKKSQKNSIKIRKNPLKKKYIYILSEKKNPLSFQKFINFGKYFFWLKTNAIFLVWPIEEISLRPELLSPPCFIIQGGTLKTLEKKLSRSFQRGGYGGSEVGACIPNVFFGIAPNLAVCL